MTNQNDSDTTIEDIHRTRERLAAKFGHDIKAILADARRRQAESGHPVWQGKPGGKPSDGLGKPRSS
jgi:hypothetical protein